MEELSCDPGATTTPRHWETEWWTLKGGHGMTLLGAQAHPPFPGIQPSPEESEGHLDKAPWVLAVSLFWANKKEREEEPWLV